MISTVVPVSLAKRTSRAADSRTCTAEPGDDSDSSVCMVWIESTTSTLARAARASSRIGLDAGLGREPQRAGLEPQPARAQRDLAHGLLAGRIQHGPLAAQRVGRLQQQRGLADARVAAEQDHRAGHEPAAEHAVELADARHRARLGLLGDLGHRAARRLPSGFCLVESEQTQAATGG